MEEADWKNFSISTEQCQQWREKLERLSDQFGIRGDMENARLMHLCSVLMARLSFDVEVETMGNPFGSKAGDC